jgi:hypothetical protein
MFGNVLAGHEKKQIEDMSFEETGVSSIFFGKGNLDLSKRAAVLAMDTWNGKNDGGVFSPKGQGAETSFLGSLLPNVGRFAVRAHELTGTGGNEKLDPVGNNLLSKVGVTSNSVHVVQ